MRHARESKLKKAMWENLFDMLDDTHDIITEKIRVSKKETPIPVKIEVRIGSEGQTKQSEK